MPPHRAQLLLCHEKIAGPMVNARQRSRDQFCSLGAYAWCFDDDYYVCDIHTISRHEGHNFAVEYPQQTAYIGNLVRRPHG